MNQVEKSLCGTRGTMRSRRKFAMFVLLLVYGNNFSVIDYRFSMFLFKKNDFQIFIIVLGTSNAQLTCHPLDPLGSEEIEVTVQIVSSKLPVIRHQGTWAFNGIALKEPEKAVLLPYFLQGHDPPCNSPQIPRRVFVQLVEKRQNIVAEVIVNLFTRTIESLKILPRGTQATYTVEEDTLAGQITKNDPQVQERCRQMGWTNLSLVVTSSWNVAYGEDNPVLKNAIRPNIVFLWGKLFDGDNHFGDWIQTFKNP